MGIKDTELPLLTLTAWADGIVVDINEGHFGHNALFTRQNTMFKDGAEKVVLTRNEKDSE